MHWFTSMNVSNGHLLVWRGLLSVCCAFGVGNGSVHTLTDILSFTQSLSLAHSCTSHSLTRKHPHAKTHTHTHKHTHTLNCCEFGMVNGCVPALYIYIYIIYIYVCVDRLLKEVLSLVCISRPSPLDRFVTHICVPLADTFTVSTIGEQVSE